MARHEGDILDQSDKPLSIDELVALLGDATRGSARHDAIACYLAGGEGWRDALKLLGGAFADAATGLREHKAD